MEDYTIRIYNGDPSITSLEVCRDFGANHAYSRWNKQIDPRWTAEQKEAYLEGYNSLSESEKSLF